MSRDDLIELLFRALESDFSDRKVKCPTPKREIGAHEPEGWHKRPLFNRDHWGSVRKDGIAREFVRPALVWDMLHDRGDEWVCTRENAFFEEEADANLFMEIEWFRGRRYVVLDFHPDSRFGYTLYRGDDLEKAMVVLLKEKGRLFENRW